MKASIWIEDFPIIKSICLVAQDGDDIYEFDMSNIDMNPYHRLIKCPITCDRGQRMRMNNFNTAYLKMIVTGVMNECSETLATEPAEDDPADSEYQISKMKEFLGLLQKM